jgi:FkbH-like protein
MNNSVPILLRTNFNTNFWKKILDKSKTCQEFSFISSSPFNIFGPAHEVDSESILVYLCRFDDFGKQTENFLFSDDPNAKHELQNSLERFLSDVIASAQKSRKTILLLPTFDSINKSLYLLKTNSKTSEKLSQIRSMYSEYIAKQTDQVLVIDPYLHGEYRGEHDERNLYWNKCPYSIASLQDISKNLCSILETIVLPRKKVLVLDLDNTLWGGVVSEDGIDGILCGTENALELSYYEFQKEIKDLKNCGFILVICSKNNEELVMETFSKRRDFALNINDFVTWRINWKSKPQGIREIAAELKLGVDSFIFIDDSQIERAQMKAELPEVAIFEMNADPILWKRDMRKFNFFYGYSASVEDKIKTELYIEDRKRTSFIQENNSDSVIDWISELEIVLKYSNLNAKNIERIEQLMNKTNQMNMSNRRLTSNQIKSESEQGIGKFYSISAQDKFGDYGSIGVVSYFIEDSSVIIKDFLLSCRILGRKVEHKILFDLLTTIMGNVNSLEFAFVETKKNLPASEFLSELGLNVHKKINLNQLKNHLIHLPTMNSIWLD